MPITVVTRNAIFDELRVRGTSWFGRCTQPDFLSRLYKLEDLPSTDPRYRDAAGDIHCHTVKWPGDWPHDWVFSDGRFELSCHDDKFLAFLAEMLHPAVRPDLDEVYDLVHMFNKHLAPDGWQLVEADRISDRPVFRPTRTGHVVPVDSVVDVLDSSYVQRQISRMRDNVERDPELAIGSAKELLETTCKTILERLGLDADAEFPGLVRRTLDGVGVDLSGAQHPDQAQRAANRLLKSLSGLGAAVGEVRNAIGTGHGRHASVGDVDATYSRLTVNATVALMTFLMDRYKAQK